MSTRKFIIKLDAGELVPKTAARLFYYGAFWLTVIQAAAITALWSRIPRVVPLFFTEPWGEARLAPKIFLFLLPILSFLSLAVNLILGRGSREVSLLLSYSLAVSTFIIVIMFSISLGGILQSLI